MGQYHEIKTNNLYEEVRDLIIEIKKLTAALNKIWKKMEVDDG